MHQLIEALSALSLLQWIIVSIVWIVSNVAIYYAFARWVLRRQWRLYRNLKRPIILLAPTNESGDVMPGGDLSTELQLLHNNGFLAVEQVARSYKTFNPIGKHCVVVVGYKPGMAGLDDLLGRIKSNHVPLIVYTYGNNLVSGPDKAKFDGYPYTLYANFPLTLLNHIFATVASFPYDRN